MNPLDRLSSIKVRLGIAIVAAVATSVGVVSLGRGVGWSWLVSAVLGGGLALLLVQLLAKGTTARLREMASAAEAMAGGDYAQRVRDAGRDEVAHLARAFNAMADQLATVDRFRRDLVANASHELRTPIAAMQAVLENVVDGVAVADSETFGLLLAQTERLGRLVSQLLDLSRLESGTVPFHREPFAIEPLLIDVARTVGSRDPSVPVEVRVIGTPLVLGDPERIHQVVTNLVDNAARHAPPWSSVVVEAHRDVDAAHVRILVTDQGPGIAPDEAARVFDRFYRVDTSRAARDGGAGLGLSIAKWVVDLHGGSIRPEAVEPHGCRMVVTLPAAVGEAPPLSNHSGAKARRGRAGECDPREPNQSECDQSECDQSE